MSVKSWTESKSLIGYIAEKQQNRYAVKTATPEVKSFLLETIRFYPSNRFLSYWKPFASIRQIFWLDPVRKNELAVKELRQEFIPHLEIRLVVIFGAKHLIFPTDKV